MERSNVCKASPGDSGKEDAVYNTWDDLSFCPGVRAASVGQKDRRKVVPGLLFTFADST